MIIDRPTAKMLLGLAVMADAVDNADIKKRMASIASILVGTFDVEIGVVYYHQEYYKWPQTTEQLLDPLVQENVNSVKNYHRAVVKRVFELVAEKEQAKLKAEAAISFATNNQPSPYGTVDQISKKYGLSKGQIRAAKAEGGNEAIKKLIEHQIGRPL